MLTVTVVQHLQVSPGSDITTGTIRQFKSMQECTNFINTLDSTTIVSVTIVWAH